MIFKDDSINPQNLQPQLVLALMVADQVYREEHVEAVVTSLNDAQHSKRSLHYSGSAVDLRISGLPNPSRTAQQIQSRLNKHYDVVLEGNHIHIEYQPEGY